MKASLLAIAALLILPTAGAAQFGSIAATRGNIRENAPVFSPSAVVLSRGEISAGASVGIFLFDDDDEFVDLSGQQISGAVAFGATDGLTLGVGVPYLRIKGEAVGEEETLSGLLPLTIGARLQILRSDDRATKLALLANLTPPTATGDWEEELADDLVWGVGAALTHDARRASLHGSLGGSFVDDFYSIEYSAAGVFVVTNQARITAELIGSKPEGGDNLLSLGGGLRYVATPDLFLDGGVLAPLDDVRDFVNAVLVFGFTWTTGPR